MSRFLKKTVLHPILFALYPPLALFAFNVGQVEFWMTARAILLSVAAAVGLLFLVWLRWRDWHRVAIFSSLVIFLLASYGHFYLSLRRFGDVGFSLARHRNLLPILIAIIGAAYWWIARKIERPSRATLTLNLIAIFALVPVLYKIGLHEIVSRGRGDLAQDGKQAIVAHEQELADLRLPTNTMPPDIYYIILDAYTREDVLQEYFDLDNTTFLNDLREMGFYVADCSRSNYSSTALSLASTLNLNYIEALGQTDYSDLTELEPLSKHSLVRGTLEALGYKTVAFESGYFVTEWEDAELYLSYTQDRSPQRLFSGVNGFEAMYLNNTIGRFFLDLNALGYLPDVVDPFLNYAYTEHRERILFILDQLEEMPSVPLEGPKLIMVHILAPHTPFVFGPEGEFVTQTETFTLKGDVFRTDRNDFVVGYRDQLLYINGRIKQLVEKILATSENLPIIIIQGDHGPNPEMTSIEARMMILNAYFLPYGGDQLLYPSISPVNTFRVIFNHYFEGDFEIIEDVSSFASYTSPFMGTVVEDPNPICHEDKP
jgi:hypothetical protein